MNRVKGETRQNFCVDFLVVGVQKGGTTSLHQYLSLHPDLFLPSGKELGYFGDDGGAKQITPEEYAAYFVNAESGQLCGEISPQYMYSTDVASAIAAHSPDAKIIVLLREPIERATSHYRMNLRRGIETRSFNEVATAYLREFGYQGNSLGPAYSYFELGEYARLVGSYLSSFPRSQLLVEYSEDFSADRMSVLERIQDHVGVKRALQPSQVDREYHVGGKERLPGLYAVKQRLVKAPAPLRKAAIRVFGRDRLRDLSHRLETEWNVSSGEARVELDHAVRRDLEEKLYEEYASLADRLGHDRRWRPSDSTGLVK